MIPVAAALQNTCVAITVRHFRKKRVLLGVCSDRAECSTWQCTCLPVYLSITVLFIVVVVWVALIGGGRVC